PVIVLIDGYTPDPEQALKLRDYVINGGTLVINTIHKKSLPSKLMPATILSQTVEEEGLIIPKIKLDGTRIVLKTASGYPLAVSHKFGNGNVIMTTPEYFLGKDLQQPTPYIGQLLETLQQEVLPFGVDGDIEFVVSRIAPDHWKVLLVNNKGLLKGTIDRKEKFDPKYVANVTLSLPTGAIAKEIYAGTKLKLTGNKVTLEVPPSGVRIIEITNAAFTGKKPSGLLGAWEFDGNIEDSSGNKRHAKGWDVKFTNIGSRSVLDFRQDQERPQVKVDFSLNYPLIAGTFEAWAAPDLDAEWDATAHPAGSGYLISTPMGLFKLYAANGYWGFIYGENRVGPPCGNGKWTHLAVTWSDFEARFYVNGKEITAQTGPIKFSEIGFPYSQYSPSFNIGAYGRGQRRRQFQGLIGGTKLYNRPLSNKEITASYRIGTEIYK
ncbi:MAG: LamG domain-containing protein, partial [Victivallaceae bacterium]|nr:LamG domain-containing protein [Victivallaceae bacterium]